MSKIEQWKEVKGFGGMYSVSNTGEVMSHQRFAEGINRLLFNRILKKLKKGSGYLGVTLSKNNKQYQKSIHRLVAENFIPNPKNKPQVNHKDGDKHNNNVDNLQWVTVSENTLHAYRELGVKGKLGWRKPNAKRRDREYMNSYHRQWRKKKKRESI